MNSARVEDHIIQAAWSNWKAKRVYFEPTTTERILSRAALDACEMHWAMSSEGRERVCAWDSRTGITRSIHVELFLRARSHDKLLIVKTLSGFFRLQAVCLAGTRKT